MSYRRLSRCFLPIVSILLGATPAAHADVPAAADEVAALPVLTANWQPEWCGTASQRCTVQAIRDFSGDGALDVLTYDGSVLRIFTGPFRGQNAASSTPRASFQLQPSGNVNIIAEDVNGDRSTDISIITAMSDPDGSFRVRIAIVYGLGAGRWPVKGAVRNLGQGDRGDAVLTYIVPNGSGRTGGRFVSSPPTIALHYGDLNADGRPDLVLSVAEAANGGRSAIVAANVTFGKPWGWMTGYLQPDMVIGGFGACTPVQSLVRAVADLDGDGMLDLVTRSCARPSAPPRLALVPGRKDWPDLLWASEAVDGVQILPPGEPTSTPEPEPEPVATLRSSTPPYYAPAAVSGNVELKAPPLIDLNGDGQLDFAVANSDGSMTSVFFGGSGFGHRLAAGRSDRMIANGSLGGALDIGAWRLAGSEGGRKDQVLMVGQLSSTTTINRYAGADGQKRLLDGRRDRSPQRWSASGVVLLGVADLSGDGVEDLLWRFDEIWDGHFYVTWGPLTR